MANKLSLILAAAFFSTPVFAGYAQLAPPAGYAVSSVGSVARIAVGTAANAPVVSGGYVMASASLNLGARSVTVPVALRIAANAPLFAATKLNPYTAALSLAVQAYPYVIDWLSRDTQAPKLQIDASGHIVIPGQTIQPDLEDWPFSNPSYPQINNLADYLSFSGHSCSGTVTVIKAGGYSPCNNTGHTHIAICDSIWNTGWSGYFCGPGAGAEPKPEIVDAQPATTERINALANLAVNPKLLPYISPDIEIDANPVINPSTFPVGDTLISPSLNPAPNLQPSPFRVPNGEPIPVPNSQQYQQPWYEITPAPTPDQPWRVQIISVTTVVESPVQVREPEPVPPSPTDCDKFPESLACMSVDEPEEEDIPDEEEEIELQDGPSFSASASCPPDLVINFQGHVFTMSMSTPCSWISMIRPVILLLAALTAVAIVRPGGGPKNVKTSL